MEEGPNIEAIIERIRHMVTVDQEMRKRAEESGFNPDAWDDSVDLANTAGLKEIIAQIGWPSISKVGKEASIGAWLLAQHADRDVSFQEECLALMQGLSEGDVRKQDIAYLTDRVRVNRGFPQVYGTQFVLDKVKGKYVPQPIEDIEQVEKHRKEMDLDTLVENTRRMNDR